MKRLSRVVAVAAVVGLVFPLAAVAAGDREGTIGAAEGDLLWTADAAHLRNSGWAQGLVMPRSEALALIRAMNRGEIENFGRRDWRLPTLRELLTKRPPGLGAQGHYELFSWINEAFAWGDPYGRDLKTAVLKDVEDDRVFAWPVIGAQVVPGVERAVILATNSAWIRQNADVLSGDVVVNDASPGPYLSSGKELTVGLGTTTPAGFALKADSIKIKSSAQVDGDVLCNELDDGSGTVTCDPLPLPVFSELPPFVEEPPREDAPDILVPIGGFDSIPPGDYGELKVKKNGTLVFEAGGVFNVGSIDAGIGTSLLFEGASEVRVAEKFEAGQNSFTGPESGAGIDASDIVFYVAGINGSNGNLGATPKAAKIGLSAQAEANFYVPNGTLWIRQNANAIGSFFGRDVQLGLNANAALDSAFANLPPIAFATSLEGIDNATILLSGSDPEGGSLSFSIVGCAAFPCATTGGGTLDQLTEIVPDPIEDPENPGTFIQPPVTQATVEYAGPGGFAEDSFSFEVADPFGATGSAVVDINPVDTSPPPAPLAEVVAEDQLIDVVADTESEITLGAGGPPEATITFAVESLPAHGSLADSAGGAIVGVPFALADALVRYTPESGFLGQDAFDFSATDGVTSDVATVTVDVDDAAELAEDLNVETRENEPVTITLSHHSGGTSGDPGPSLLVGVTAPAMTELTASVAGNVADANGDGEGDNHNDLPGPTPVLIAAAVDSSGGPGSNGTVRIHVEFSIGGLVGDPQFSPFQNVDEIQNATVTVTTSKGSVDSLDTFYFVGADSFFQDLGDDDFQSPVGSESVATMPVPPGARTGDEGTFSFEVTTELKGAINQGQSLLIVQGRVDESLTGQGFQRGLQVFSSADGNIATGKVPSMSVGSAAATLLSLPGAGTLTFNGAAVSVGQTFAVNSNLVYTPSFGFTGNDSFIYQVAEGGVVDSATVFIFVDVNNCIAQGREPGCAPGGN